MNSPLRHHRVFQYDNSYQREYAIGMEQPWHHTTDPNNHSESTAPTADPQLCATTLSGICLCTLPERPQQNHTG